MTDFTIPSPLEEKANMRSLVLTSRTEQCGMAYAATAVFTVLAKIAVSLGYEGTMAFVAFEPCQCLLTFREIRKIIHSRDVFRHKNHTVGSWLPQAF